jgi:hypothetical protein
LSQDGPLPASSAGPFGIFHTVHSQVQIAFEAEDIIHGTAKCQVRHGWLLYLEGNKQLLSC